MEGNHLFIQHGDNPESMTRRVLERSGVRKEFRPGMKVGLKPNLVMAKPASSGATTHVSIVKALVETLQSWGITDITIMESAWVGDSTKKAYRVCGYEDLARKTGVRLMDLKTAPTTHLKAGSLELEVCRPPLEVDYLINLPVMKGHCQTRMTCALKNMKGCIPDTEKSRFHTIGLHEPIAAVNTLLRQDLILVDAMNGDLTYEGGGSPVPLNRLILGKDPVLVDAWAASFMGYELEEIQHLAMAAAMGVGSADLSKAEILQEGKAVGKIDRDAIRGDAAAFREYIDEKAACSACYATLIHALRQMEEKGRLHQLEKVLSVGQGFKGVQGKGIGIGSCTSGFRQQVPGCPPDPQKILSFLMEHTAPEK